MGCGGSKLEPDELPGAGSGTFRHRVDQLRRRRLDGGRACRKGSIVSTRGLLRPEEEEDHPTLASDEEALASPPATATTTMTPPRPVEVECMRPPVQEEEKKTKRDGAGGEKQREEEEEEENKKKGVEEGEKRRPRGAALLDGRGSGRSGHHDEEDLPGSPSFRVYFVGSARESSDDDSVNTAVRNARNTKKNICNSERKDSIDSSSEGSEGKHSKRHRGKRFKGLPKGPSAVYGLLNVRSCYSNARPPESPNQPCHSSCRNNTTVPNENPNSLRSEKVA